jgi:predicted ATPase
VEALTEALAMLPMSRVRWWEAELYRLRGELLLIHGTGRGGSRTTPPEDEAEASLRQALEVAHRQQAKSLELRAAMSLSQLWRRRGRQDEARQMLAEIYGWFTEGFDTTDLQEAKALLEELSR